MANFVELKVRGRRGPTLVNLDLVVSVTQGSADPHSTLLVVVGDDGHMNVDEEYDAVHLKIRQRDA